MVETKPNTNASVDDENREVEDLEAALNEIESALDNLESQNDTIHTKLKALLESNREMRREMASIIDKKDETHAPPPSNAQNGTKSDTARTSSRKEDLILPKLPQQVAALSMGDNDSNDVIMSERSQSQRHQQQHSSSRSNNNAK